MNTCSNPQLQEMLLLYIEGELTILQAEQVSDHVRACPVCEQEAKSLSESLRLVAGMKTEKVPAWLHLRLKQIFSKKSFLDYLASLFLLNKPTLALATHASLAILLLLGGFYYNQMTSRSSENMAVVVPVRSSVAMKVQPNSAAPTVRRAAVRPQRQAPHLAAKHVHKIVSHPRILVVVASKPPVQNRVLTSNTKVQEEKSKSSPPVLAMRRETETISPDEIKGSQSGASSSAGASTGEGASVPQPAPSQPSASPAPPKSNGVAAFKAPKVAHVVKLVTRRAILKPVISARKKPESKIALAMPKKNKFPVQHRTPVTLIVPLRNAFSGYYLMFASILFWALAGIAASRLSVKK